MAVPLRGLCVLCGKSGPLSSSSASLRLCVGPIVVAGL